MIAQLVEYPALLVLNQKIHLVSEIGQTARHIGRNLLGASRRPHRADIKSQSHRICARGKGLVLIFKLVHSTPRTGRVRSPPLGPP